jgi:hypothetical protein
MIAKMTEPGDFMDDLMVMSSDLMHKIAVSW